LEKEDEVRKYLLRKIYKLGAWGKHHVCESNLPKGFPSHLCSLVKDVAHDLKKEGLLVCRPSGHDSQWYLNRNKLKEIEQIIKEFLSK